MAAKKVKSVKTEEKASAFEAPVASEEMAASPSPTKINFSGFLLVRLAIILIVVVGVGVGAYFYFQSNKTKDPAVLGQKEQKSLNERGVVCSLLKLRAR